MVDHYQIPFYPLTDLSVSLSCNSKIEDAFYANKLRLNGRKLIKKSKAVSDEFHISHIYIMSPAAPLIYLTQVVFCSVTR